MFSVVQRVSPGNLVFRIPPTLDHQKAMKENPNADPATTVATFIERSLQDKFDITLPPKPPKPERRNSWSHMTREERSAYAKYLASLRSPENMRRKGRVKGTVVGLKKELADHARAVARVNAESLVTKMRRKGLVKPEDVERTIEALTCIASPGERLKRLRAARKLLKEFAPRTEGGSE
jgi:RNase H-fold protein (predicted Holliday junction resolvase)